MSDGILYGEELDETKLTEKKLLVQICLRQDRMQPAGEANHLKANAAIAAIALIQGYIDSANAAGLPDIATQLEKIIA